MKILILGSGGREHVFAWKLHQSPLVKKVFVAPGNAGTSSVAENLAISVTDFEQLGSFCEKEKPDMVIVGPEDPLVQGIHDYFLKNNKLKNIPVIGPVKEAARLEGSKDFAKEFMQRHHIPTASHKSFSTNQLSQGLQYLERVSAPWVLKADGLAAGKGVLIINDLAEAKAELTEMLLNKKFGAASEKVVIEAFLSGQELSCFVLTDEESYKMLPLAKDYKRIGEGDTGPNTGGMGAISPVPFADDTFVKKIQKRIIQPTLNGLKKEGIPYTGFLFIGLIKVDEDPFVIEYNVRMGDPETQVVFPRIKNDLAQLFLATSRGQLDSIKININSDAAATVILASEGYPGAYEKNKTISGVNDIDNSIVFHSGTKRLNNSLITNGGRVMALTSMAPKLEEALKKSYTSAEKISFAGKNYRKDIGSGL